MLMFLHVLATSAASDYFPVADVMSKRGRYEANYYPVGAAPTQARNVLRL